MNISDEAVEAAFAAFYEKCDVDFDAAQAILAALEAAAPHLMAPRVVTTGEELDALAEGSMVRTDAGFYMKEAIRHGHSTWVTTNEQYYFNTDDIPLPAMVIYTPYRSAGAGE